MQRLASFIAPLTLAACAAATIPDTQIEDTPDTRAIYAVVEQWQKAMQDHHAESVLALASPSYFEDFATIKTEDDRGFEQLKRELGDYLARVKRLDLMIRVKDIKVEGVKAHVDYFFTQRALFTTPTGDEWREKNDDSRLVLEKNAEGAWKVVAGL